MPVRIVDDGYVFLDVVDRDGQEVKVGPLDVWAYIATMADLCLKHKGDLAAMYAAYADFHAALGFPPVSRYAIDLVYEAVLRRRDELGELRAGAPRPSSPASTASPASA